MKFLEYAFKRFGPNMMPNRRPKWKYEPLAEKLRKAANSLHKIDKAIKIVEEAEKKNPNHLIF